MLCVWCVWHKTQREKNRREVPEKQINEMRTMSVSKVHLHILPLLSDSLLMAVSKPLWCALQHACLWLKTLLWLCLGIKRSHRIWSGKSSAMLDGGRKLNTCFRNATAYWLSYWQVTRAFCSWSHHCSFLCVRSHSFVSFLFNLFFFVHWVSKFSG